MAKYYIENFIPCHILIHFLYLTLVGNDNQHTLKELTYEQKGI